MTLTKHPRRLARIAGLFYVTIIVSAVFAYLYVRGGLIVPGDMAKTGANLLAHEQLYRLGFLAAIVTVLCNPPMGVFLTSLLKVVNPRLALLALIFITISTTIEAMSLLNYIAPLFTFSLPEYRAAFGPEEIQALARGAIRLYGYTFAISLAFFGVFCALTGYLIVRSKFLPRIIGALMIAGGVCYLLDDVTTFLALPDIPYLIVVPLVAETSLALWLVVVGVNAAKWREQAGAG